MRNGVQARRDNKTGKAAEITFDDKTLGLEHQPVADSSLQQYVTGILRVRL